MLKLLVLTSATIFSVEEGEAERFACVCERDGRSKQLHSVPVDAHVSFRVIVKR